MYDSKEHKVSIIPSHENYYRPLIASNSIQMISYYLNYAKERDNFFYKFN